MTDESVDVMILLAGSIVGKALDVMQEIELFQCVYDNFTAPAALIRRLLPFFSIGARLLLVSSVAGERGSYDAIYAGSKGALIPFAKSIASWLGHRMTINVVCPGPIDDSSMFNGMNAERVHYHRAASPTGELLNRKDFAEILLDLTRPHWRHANGAVIRVNEGVYV
jgi:3-oxoacyl-[acyl-carrier protein] reductase